MSDLRWPPLRFAPYLEASLRPNVVVDGRANEATTLTLSHWPKAVSPPELRRDLSAEMALAYLGHPGVHGAADVVTNNHFDQDGLAGVFTLCEPHEAQARRALLVDVAAAGDFGTYRIRDAARISMAIAAMADPERSPLDHVPFAESYDAACASLYAETLPRLVDLLDHPDRARELWAAEDDQLARDEEAVASGAVQIEEVPELDLSVVTLAAGTRSDGGHRFGGTWSPRIHPMALHRSIDGLTVLVRQGSWCELRYRYESWVQYVSRPVRPRVDLTVVAGELSAAEPGGGNWVFDGVGDLTPALHREDGGDSDLDPDLLRRTVEHALRTLPPAWDPRP